jgi:quercetin dioxygenase-like cupin family protein
MNSNHWSKRNAEGVSEKISGALSFRLLNAEDESRQRITFMHIKLPSCGGHSAVRHDHTQEWVYVLKGAARAKIDGETVSLRVGDYLFLPKGTWHEFTATEEGVEAISIFDPPLDWSKPDVITADAA